MPGTMPCHVTLLLLQSHFAAIMQSHKPLWYKPMMALIHLMICCIVLQEQLAVQNSTQFHTALQTSVTCCAQVAGCSPNPFTCCCRFANIQKEKRELQDRLVDYALQAMDTSTDNAFAESAGARSIAAVDKQKSQEAEAVIAEVKLVTIQRLNVNVCGSGQRPACCAG